MQTTRQNNPDKLQATLLPCLSQRISTVMGIVFLFFASSPSFANSEALVQVASVSGATIVFPASDTGKIVITEGKITAVKGKTVHLLPGTHIKSSKQLTVNIASKECQEAVAREVEKANEEKMLATVATKREEVLPEEKNALTLPSAFCFLVATSIPVSNSTISQQTPNPVAFLSNTPVSFNAPVVYLTRKNNESIVNHKSQISNRFLPVTSWGECAESISIMRC